MVAAHDERATLNRTEGQSKGKGEKLQVQHFHENLSSSVSRDWMITTWRLKPNHIPHWYPFNYHSKYYQEEEEDEEEDSHINVENFSSQ